jgi:hypothetical protein
MTSPGNTLLKVCIYLRRAYCLARQVVYFQQGEVGSNRADKTENPWGCRRGGFAMIRSLAATLFALVVMASLAVPVQADTIAISGTLMETITFTATANLAVFVGSATGSGVDSVLGAYTTTSSGPLTFSSPTAFTNSGTFVDVFAGGTLFGTSSGNGTQTGNTSTGTTNVVITGGTGIFAGDTGQSTLTGTCTGTGPTTCSFTGTYTGSITTPEPSSLALMLAAIGFVPLIRNRLARGRQAT